MKIFLSLFILQILSVLACAQDWSSLNGNRAQECQQDENFCMTFCLSFKPGTVKAQCGKDLISCICTTPDHHSVKVRFIEERQPAPPTTPAPPPIPPVEYVVAESTRPNPSVVGQYPELLVCDSSVRATEVCNYFCITEIGGFRGFCNISDYTCVCQGVSPAVVQSVPIPAVLQRPIPPPVPPVHRPAPLPQSPQNSWTPITPDHPNYDQNSVSNIGFPNQQQQFQPNQQQQFQPNQQQQFQPHQQQQFQPNQQQQFQPNQQQQFQPNQQQQFQPSNSQLTPPMTSNSHNSNSQPHLYMYPQPQLQQSFQVFDQVPHENQSDEGIELHKNPNENPTEQAGNSSSLETPTVHHQRKRRSAGSSYANVYSSFGMNHEHQRACSILSCQQACAKNGFNLPKCLPQCTEAGCICICKPEILDSVIDSILASFENDHDDDGMNKKNQGQIMGTFGYEREPLDKLDSMSTSTDRSRPKPAPTDPSRPQANQDEGFTIFTAPPSLY